MCLSPRSARASCLNCPKSKPCVAGSLPWRAAASKVCGGPARGCNPSPSSRRWPTFAAARVGRRIESVDRVGKRIVLELDSGDRIVLEPRMTGLVLLADPPDAGHLRLVFELSPEGGLSRFSPQGREAAEGENGTVPFGGRGCAGGVAVLGPARAGGGPAGFAR